MRRITWMLSASTCGWLLAAPDLLAQETLDAVDDIVENERQRPRQGDIETRVDLPSDAMPGASQPVLIKHIRFLGDSVLDLAELSHGLQAMIGRSVSRADIEAELQTINAAYQERGYPLSFAYLPAKNFEEGQLRIVLVEGHIARTEIVLEDEAVAARVEHLVAPLLDERPLTRATFERVTGLIERIPGARLSLRAPVPRTPNGATTLRVEQRRIDHFDYSGSLNGGDEQDTLFINRVTTKSLTSHADTLGFSWLWPVENDNEFYALDYRQAIGNDGLMISASADSYRGKDEDNLTLRAAGDRFDLDQRQDTDRERYRLGLDYPLLLSRQQSLTLSGALTHREERKTTRIDFEGQTLRQLDDDIAYSAAEVDLRYQRQNDATLWQGGIGVRQGMDLGANAADRRLDGIPIDTNADLHFTHWRLNGEWRRLFAERWRLSASADAFYSDDALPEPERGSYGGQRFGRGYDAGQAEGDSGYAGSLELRYLQPIDAGWISRLAPYVAIDGARTQFHDLELDSHLASAAFGIQLSKGRLYGLTLEYAEPLGDKDIDTDSREGRINARLRWNFEG